MKKEFWFVAVSGILSGTIVFGNQLFVNAGLSFFQIAIIPLLFTFLLLPWMILKKEYHVTKEMTGLFALVGFITLIGSFAEVIPLILGVPIAVVVLLLYTQPFWTAIFGRIFLKEKITKKKILAIISVLIGAVILVNPFVLDGMGNVWGVILALLGGISLSSWVILGRVSGIKKCPPVTTKFSYTFFKVFFLFVAFLIIPLFIKNPIFTKLSFNLPLLVWIYLLVFAVVSNIVPHLFYFAGAKKVHSSDAGIILLLEPVSAAILAVVFLKQPLTLNILMGGLFILAANYLVAKEERK